MQFIAKQYNMQIQLKVTCTRFSGPREMLKILFIVHLDCFHRREHFSAKENQVF